MADVNERQEVPPAPTEDMTSALSASGEEVGQQVATPTAPLQPGQPQMPTPPAAVPPQPLTGQATAAPFAMQQPGPNLQGMGTMGPNPMAGMPMAPTIQTQLPQQHTGFSPVQPNFGQSQLPQYMQGPISHVAQPHPHFSQMQQLQFQQPQAASAPSTLPLNEPVAQTALMDNARRAAGHAAQLAERVQSLSGQFNLMNANHSNTNAATVATLGAIQHQLNNLERNVELILNGKRSYKDGPGAGAGESAESYWKKEGFCGYCYKANPNVVPTVKWAQCQKHNKGKRAKDTKDV